MCRRVGMIAFFVGVLSLYSPFAAAENLFGQFGEVFSSDDQNPFNPRIVERPPSGNDYGNAAMSSAPSQPFDNSYLCEGGAVDLSGRRVDMPGCGSPARASVGAPEVSSDTPARAYDDSLSAAGMAAQEFIGGFVAGSVGAVPVPPQQHVYAPAPAPVPVYTPPPVHNAGTGGPCDNWSPENQDICRSIR